MAKTDQCWFCFGNKANARLNYSCVEQRCGAGAWKGFLEAGNKRRYRGNAHVVFVWHKKQRRKLNTSVISILKALSEDPAVGRTAAPGEGVEHQPCASKKTGGNKNHDSLELTSEENWSAPLWSSSELLWSLSNFFTSVWWRRLIGRQA